ncbi:uncharacterized protein LOC142321825 isoform X2 [Lycorma delicatula]|uniref:uncharacterized protein LOC142321825 isoform X2 n=1 Tax=Lycorma delicatula TaxID=130591 RepID=UPI003F5170A6
MRAKICIIILMTFNAVNALLELNPNEYTECTRDETISCSCQSMDDCVIKEIKPTTYLKDLFGSKIISVVTMFSHQTPLHDLNHHKYFQSNIFKIDLFEENKSKNRNDIIPTLLELLNKIPENIMIKEGIIHTKGKSLISGIKVKNLSNYNKNAIIPPNDIAENINVLEAPRCYDRIMDCTYLSLTFKCGDHIQQYYFRDSYQNSLKTTVEMYDMSCFLHSSRHNETDKYNYVQRKEFKKEGKQETFKGLHFELYFSYTCKLFIRVPAFYFTASKFYYIPVYQSYRFTVGGYHLKREHSNQISGLTYLVTQKPINNEIFPEE